MAGIEGKNTKERDDVDNRRCYGYGELSFERACDDAAIIIAECVGNYHAQVENQKLYTPLSFNLYTNLTPEQVQILFYDELLNALIPSKKFCGPQLCDTMCTDGNTLYINPYFVLFLENTKEVFFVLAHELSHIMLDHLSDFRFGAFFKRLENEADMPSLTDRVAAQIINTVTDLVINDRLVKDKVGAIPRYKKGHNAGKIFGLYIENFSDEYSEKGIINYVNAQAAAAANIFGELSNGGPEGARQSMPPLQNGAATLSEARTLLNVMIEHIKTELRAISEMSPDAICKLAPKVRELHASLLTKSAAESNITLETMATLNLLNIAEELLNEAIINGLSEKKLDLLVEKILSKMARGEGELLDDHETTYKLSITISQRNGVTLAEEKNRRRENQGRLMEKIFDKFESHGITPDQLRAIGAMGADFNRIYQARQIRPDKSFGKIMDSLFKTVKGCRKNNYAKYNKKTSVMNRLLAKTAGSGAAKRIIIPSRENKAGKIVVGIDTSGSIFNDETSMETAAGIILRTASVLNARYTGSSIEVVCCDTELTKIGEAGNPAEMRDIIDSIKQNGLPIKGGGGTDLLPIWNYAAKLGKDAKKEGKLPPSALIVITDTFTYNGEEIAALYRKKECRLPTMIVAPDSENTIPVWKKLAEECLLFMLSDLAELTRAHTGTDRQ